MSKKVELLKTAAAALRHEHTEKNAALEKVAELQAELDRVQAAQALTFRLWKMGSFPAEDLEEQLDSFLEKSSEEIETFEKAAHLLKQGNRGMSLDIGKVSEHSEYYGSPEERFIYNLLEE